MTTSHDTIHDMLIHLRKEPYEQVRDYLLQFPGIGPKVADCICLMSMDKTNVVPVDTHVRTIAERDYGVGRGGGGRGRPKSLTPAVYQQIQEKFESIFGDYAGWAHAVRSWL
jgi:N-glycosylase/DNA lyase